MDTKAKLHTFAYRYIYYFWPATKQIKKFADNPYFKHEKKLYDSNPDTPFFFLANC